MKISQCLDVPQNLISSKHETWTYRSEQFITRHLVSVPATHLGPNGKLSTEAASSLPLNPLHTGERENLEEVKSKTR